MAKQSQINLPTIEELKAAYMNPVSQFDPSKITSQYATGMTLQDTITAKSLERQKAEEDLKKEIAAAKALAQQGQLASEFGAKPSLPAAQKAFPAKAAESMFNIEEQKAKPKAEDVRGNYVRQLYQDPSGQSFAVLGKIDKQGNPIVVPVGNAGQNQPFIKPTMPAEQVEKTGGYESLGLIVNRIRKDIIDPKTGQVSEHAKGFLGLMDAPAAKAKAFTPFADPTATSALQKIQDLKNQIIYLRSGKQINEEEYKRLKASMPSEVRDESVFLSDLANFEKTFEDIKRERAEAFQTAGYRNVQFPGIPENQMNTGNAGGLTPEKAARLAELRRKKAEGTLGR